MKPRARLGIEALEDRLVPTAQPNILFIMTDDQDVGTLQYMPRVRELLADQGVTFENSFVTSPICLPANITALTGQYAVNHDILNNIYPTGGFQKFTETGGDESTLAVWLDEAGYHTGRIGKYLVQYPDGSTYVPPGWDEWQSTYDGFTSYLGYRMNVNGTVVQYGSGEADYITDVLSDRVVDFINRAEANDAQPFFLQFNPTTPHSGVDRNGPPTPAPRHAGMFAGLQAPRTPSFNEADVSDKPPPVGTAPLLTAAQIAAIDLEYQARIEALQSLDEGVGRIVAALAARGELENTYIVFTSDNGYHLGQHRFLNGKFQVYEEDIRVPLIVRGPGVEAGAVRDELAVNIDLAPTMTRWGGATADRVMDGQSLAPLLGEGGGDANWRTDFLVELYRHLPPAQNGDVIRALRTEHEVYVEYRSGPRELYDLRTDPFQLQNAYATADPARVAVLSARLAELAASRGNPPTVERVVVNDGSAQRSMVTSVTVTFDRVVTLDPGAFEVRRAGGAAVNVTVAAAVVGGRSVAVLTFSGPGVVGGSLADGDYTLTVHGGRVRDAVGRELDGDGDGNGGGDRTAGLHRLFGDSDGDRDVDVRDLARFLSAVGRRPGTPGYQAYFDVDGDDRVGVIDTLAFACRLGSRLAP